MKKRGGLSVAPALCGHRIACSDYGGEHLPDANGRLLAANANAAASSVCDFERNTIFNIARILYTQSLHCQIAAQARRGEAKLCSLWRDAEAEAQGPVAESVRQCLPGSWRSSSQM